MQSWLEDANIKSKVILDSAVGYVAKPPVEWSMHCAMITNVNSRTTQVPYGESGLGNSGSRGRG